MTEATPRPWRVENPMGDYLSIVVGDQSYDWRFIAHVHTDIEKGSTVKPIGKSQMAANAALIVRAVNTYDERDALLREAAKAFAHIAEYWNGSRTDGAMADALDIILDVATSSAARIRKALGETA